MYQKKAVPLHPKLKITMKLKDSKDDRHWLPYSERIASRAVKAITEQHISQRQLAERMGCSPQYVSRILKGKENLSLETICKLENALNEHILRDACVD